MDNENGFQKVELNEEDYKGTVKFARRLKKIGLGAAAGVTWLLKGDNIEKVGNFLNKALESASNITSKYTKK